MSYHFFIGKILCPIAPSSLQLKIGNKNKTMTLINEGEVNVLKQAGLTEISFNLLLPNVKYPFAIYKSGFQNAKYFLNEIEKLKTNNKPFQFIVTRSLPSGKILFDTNMKVSLENYEIKEDTNQGFDVVVSVKLKQYREYGTKNLISSSNGVYTVENNRPTEDSPEPLTNRTHVVKNGDTLWSIAKKYYGNGSKYTVIYNANKNKIKNQNSITAGQVLIIPAL